MTTGDRLNIRARNVWVLVLVAVVLSVATSGYAFFRWDAARIRRDRYNELAAVAELKAGQIVQWRQERLNNASNTAESPFFARAVQAWLKDPGNAILRSEFLQRLRLEQQGADCSDALLLDLNGRILLAARDDPGAVDAATMQVVTLAISDRRARLTELFRQSGGDVRMDAVAPVSGANNRSVAVIVLRIDPTKFLYPLIQSWPIPSRSAETLLVRRDGDDILFLNQLRHRAGAALSFRTPLARTELPSVQAVAGKKGMFEGKDYRGVDVLGDLRPVPGSEWFLVAKTDASEILADMRYRARVVAIVVVLLILFAAAAVAGLYRHRQAHVYLALYDSEQENRQAQESLQQSQARLHEAHRLAHIGAWDWDVDSDSVTWTEELYRIVGRDPTLPALTYAEHSTLYVPESWERLQDAVERALKTGEPYQLELTLVRPDGQSRCVNAFGGRKVDIDGRVTGLHGVLQDITERKQAETALRDSETHLKLLFENGLESFVFVDRNRVIQSINQVASDRARAVFGLELRRGDSIYGAVLPHDREAFDHDFQNALDGEWIRVERTFATDAGERSFEFHYSPVHAHSGQTTGVFMSVLDITDRKQMEAERKKLEAQTGHLQKSESLGRMAGAVAHHFNNQLQVVMGNLEIAQGELRGDEWVIQCLNEAMKATRKAVEVSGLMLTYLGQTPSTRDQLDLSEACRLALPIVDAAMPKRVRLESELPFPGPIVHANANQVQQILTNLVANAWEAGRDGQGTIRLTVKTVAPDDIPTSHRFPIDWQPPNAACACLEVADDGCGIADRDIERIFDPFFSTKFTGRGMGLPVVLGIVRAHEGAITVESASGTGSIFRVYFPLTTEAFPRLPEKVDAAIDLHASGTVLVVEDEDMVRSLAMTILTRLGFTVLSARDGAEAVEVFREHAGEIRCVLCDLTMPRMDGWETLTALRQIAPDLPVILASGYTEAQVMEGAHAERPQAFLSKPYRREELREAIRQALRA